MDAHHRSKEAPMDFQFTSRPSSGTKPVWARSTDDCDMPRKRPRHELNPTPSASPSIPTFGRNPNVPFIFRFLLPKTANQYPWAPNFLPRKAFPQLSAPELRNVDISDASSSRTEETETENGRTVAMGALGRVYKSRQRARAQPHSRRNDEYPEHTSNDDSENERVTRPLTQNTSNHYAVNIAPAPAFPPDTPYVLLGYLRFVFNLVLVLVLSYLLVQFILTVQRDVEHRVSESSMDIVQEIGVCAVQYKNNHCETNQIPAMAHQCVAWENCMNRDPTTVGRTRIGAGLIAEVVNGFFEPISWKTLASLIFLTLFVNAFIPLYRSHHQPAPSPPLYPYLPLVPNLGAHQKGKVANSSGETPHRRRSEGR